MVKDLLILATDGLKTFEDITYGLSLVDEIASNNYKWLIEETYQVVYDNTTRKEARQAVQKLIYATYNNAPASHHYSIWRAAHRFGFYTI